MEKKEVEKYKPYTGFKNTTHLGGHAMERPERRKLS